MPQEILPHLATSAPKCWALPAIPLYPMDTPVDGPTLTEMKLAYKFFTIEEAYYDHAKVILAAHFKSEEELQSFYDAIPSTSQKLLFLETCGKYRFLVKDGDWTAKVNGNEQVIDYLTNSHKLLGILALIESLNSVKFEQFHNWLRKQPSVFPIYEKSLVALNQKYNDEHGATRKVVKFFEALSHNHQARLCGLLTKDKQPMASVKKLAQFLYEMRSKFAHEGQPAVALHSNAFLQYKGKDSVLVKITIADVMEAFELGLIAHFKQMPQSIAGPTPI